ncbi:hypothetical protein UFOVP1247_276 [uncultured Caudovirales phage]|uniref:Uncharacterized protein n=1 Tax=uncultured Caudovirales phage TaxID=2100421 RepID=A0A6J5PUW6_9CAUD|nr:hypothetical protein UFOVP970_316 [uncultured Caudovirales phage]CAB4193905.1 hypothetical protein UFOVP1247_276 [uncultured Caudovirales phage]
MDAKLIKTEVNYLLKNEEGVIIASTSLKNLGLALSLKNCQAIELGYDLDDSVECFKKGKAYIQQDGVIILAGENATDGIVIKDPLKSRDVGHYSDSWNPKAFCEYNLEALEILGDKKFSEEDMIKMWEAGANRVFIDTHPIPDYKATIQSLQQTEWDVWLVMACGLPDGCTEPEVTCTCDIIPSLDTDGYLILKRK